MIRLAMELEEMAWRGYRDLDEVSETGLSQEGLDILDSLAHHPDLAPVMLHIHSLGVDLEPHGDDPDDAPDDLAS